MSIIFYNLNHSFICLVPDSGFQLFHTPQGSAFLRVPNGVLQSRHPDQNFLSIPLSRRFLPANPDPDRIFLSPYLNKNDP